MFLAEMVQDYDYRNVCNCTKDKSKLGQNWMSTKHEALKTIRWNDENVILDWDGANILREQERQMLNTKESDNPRVVYGFYKKTWYDFRMTYPS